jgi:hypothetical protein
MKSAALTLYRKRKTEVLEGRKLPEKLRRSDVSFAEVARDALEYSHTTKVPDAYRIDRWHMETILGWFRERGAEEITPQDIERRLNEIAEQGRTPATVNRYSGAPESCCVLTRDSQWQIDSQPCSAGQATQGKTTREFAS